MVGRLVRPDARSPGEAVRPHRPEAKPAEPQGTQAVRAYSILSSMSQVVMTEQMMPYIQVLRVPGDQVRAGRLLLEREPGRGGREVQGARAEAHRVHARVRVQGLVGRADLSELEIEVEHSPTHYICGPCSVMLVFYLMRNSARTAPVVYPHL